MRNRLSDIEIRSATEADVDAMASIKRTREDELYKNYGTEEEHQIGLEEFCSPAYVTALLNSHDSNLLVAAARGSTVVLGMVAVGLREDCAWVSSLFVGESGAGVGAALMAAAVRLAADGARPLIRCEVFARNDAALQFFQRLSFKPVGSRSSMTYPTQLLLELEAETAAVQRQLPLS